MGQAKHRAAEIAKLKAQGSKSNTNEFGLLDFMYKLGDGAWADENRNAMLVQILDTMKANIQNVVSNAQAGKTTLAQGIQIGFEPGKLTNLPDYHISVEHPGFFQAAQEFVKAVRANPADKHLQMGFMASKDTKTLAPFLAYMNPICNIVITKWAHGTIIRFFDDAGVSHQQFSGDPDKDAESIADFAKSMSKYA